MHQWQQKLALLIVFCLKMLKQVSHKLHSIHYPSNLSFLWQALSKLDFTYSGAKRVESDVHVKLCGHSKTLNVGLDR